MYFKKTLSDLNAHLAVSDADGVGFQAFFLAYYIQGLDARWEVGPFDDVAAGDIKFSAMDGALQDLAIQKLPFFERHQKVGTGGLDGVIPTIQAKQQNFFAVYL